MAGWVCHSHLHAVFEPRTPEFDIRPRVLSYIVGGANVGKTPFWRHCVAPFFHGLPGRPPVVSSHKQLFKDGGPKGLLISQATQADFAQRMDDTKGTGGQNMWATDEGVSVLDTPHAAGTVKFAPKRDTERVHMGYLLGTQNGFAYGPVSIKGEKSHAYFAPTTNFGFFHCGQPKAIHEYWGHALRPSSPISGQGYELRPTFLWAIRVRDDDPNRPLVSFGPAASCLRVIWLTLAALVGHRSDKRFHEASIGLSDTDREPAQDMWRSFHTAAEQCIHAGPPYAAGVLGKHCFTTPAHIVLNHLMACAFAHAKQHRGQVGRLLSGDPSYLEHLAKQPLAAHWGRIPAEQLIAAPAHLSHMLYGVVTIVNEMRLPEHERADALPSLPSLSRGGHGETTTGQHPQAPKPLTAEEEALAILLQRYSHKEVITVTDANAVLSQRSGFRNNQDALCRVFDLACELRAGNREGAARQTRGKGGASRGPAANPLQLRLSIGDMSADARDRLRLMSSVLVASSSVVPSVSVGGNLQVLRVHADEGLPVIDFGDRLFGLPDSCIALHLIASILSAPGLNGANRDLLVQASCSLATGVPVAIQFAEGIPSVFAGIHAIMMEARVAISVFIAKSFSDRSPVSETLQLGSHSPATTLCPLLVGYQDRHCVLWVGEVAPFMCRAKPMADFSLATSAHDSPIARIGGMEMGVHRVPQLGPPTPEAAWARLCAWAAEPAASGEPFPVTLRQYLSSDKKRFLCARGRCKANANCNAEACSFTAFALYDAEANELVFRKSSPHSGRPRASTLAVPMFGFQLASVPVFREEPPSSQEASQLLSVWAADTARSGEPFALELRVRNSGRSPTSTICRMQCWRGASCTGMPSCRFVVQANFDAETKLFYITKKNGHGRDDSQAHDDRQGHHQPHQSQPSGLILDQQVKPDLSTANPSHAPCRDIDCVPLSGPISWDETLEVFAQFRFPRHAQTWDPNGDARIAEAMQSIVHEEARLHTAVSLQWFFGADYPWFRAVRDRQLEFFTCMCLAGCVPKAVHSSQEASEEQKTAVSLCWEGFQKHIMPLVDRVFNFWPAQKYAGPVYRGVAFPDLESLERYLAKLRDRGFVDPESFSLSANVAAQFADTTSSDKGAFIGFKSVIQHHLLNAGYALPSRRHGCILACDGFCTLDITPLKRNSAHEEERWIRSGKVEISHRCKSAVEAAAFFRNPLNGVVSRLGALAKKDILRGMRSAATGTTIELIVLTPSDAGHSPSRGSADTARPEVSGKVGGPGSSALAARLRHPRSVCARQLFDCTPPRLFDPKDRPASYCAEEWKAIVNANSDEQIHNLLQSEATNLASGGAACSSSSAPNLRPSDAFQTPLVSRSVAGVLTRKRKAAQLLEKASGDSASPASRLPGAAGKKGSGRYRQGASPYHVLGSWVIPGGCVSQEKFRKYVQTWGKTTKPGRLLDILTQGRKVKAGEWRYKFWCGSCTNCCTLKGRPSGKGWSGIANYHIATQTVTVQQTSLERHGTFDRKTGKTNMGSTAKHALKEQLRHSAMPVQQLLQLGKTRQLTPLRERKLGDFSRNFRKRHVLQGNVRWPTHQWATCDWQRLFRSTLQFADVRADNENDLCIVGAKLLESCTVVVFCNPAFVKELCQRLVNKKYIKMCGDGTFRMMREQWILITLGFLTKHYSASRGDSFAAFRTTFSGCFFAISNKESAPAYKFLFECACAVVRRLCDIDLHVVVRQYHADWHAGEELARQEVFPNSVRCGDWAHFVGACSVRTRTATHPQTPRGLDGETSKAWRVGVYCTIRGCFDTPTEQDNAVDLLKPVFEVTRCVPTLCLFHFIWHHTFVALRSQGPAAEACVNKLKRLYFVELPAEQANDVWKMQSWDGDTRWVYYAAWWSGLERVQPGSASGSQAQEAWHKNPFKTFMKTLYVSIPDFVEKLRRFCETRLEQLLLEDEPLPDRPTEPWPDRCLMDAPKMFQHRRSAAQEFLDSDQLSKWTDADGDGSTYYAMRHHLLAWCPAGHRWERQEHPTALPAGLAQYLTALYRGRSSEALTAALVNLGVATPSDINSMVRALSKYVLVVVGPAASEHWHTEGPASEGLFPHALALCAFCWEAGMHATCEHAYAAFLDPANHHPGLPLDLTVAEHPVRRTRRHVAPERMLMETPAAVLPATARRDPGVQDPSAVRCDPLVLQILRAFDVSRLARSFAENELTLDELQHWELSAFLALPFSQSIAAAKARAIHRCFRDAAVRQECLDAWTERERAIPVPVNHAPSTPPHTSNAYTPERPNASEANGVDAGRIIEVDGHRIRGPSAAGYYSIGGRDFMRVQEGTPRASQCKLTCYRHANCFIIRPLHAMPDDKTIARWVMSVEAAPPGASKAQTIALKDQHRARADSFFVTTE